MKGTEGNFCNLPGWAMRSLYGRMRFFYIIGMDFLCTV